MIAPLVNLSIYSYFDKTYLQLNVVYGNLVLHQPPLPPTNMR